MVNKLGLSVGGEKETVEDINACFIARYISFRLVVVVRCNFPEVR